MASDVDTTATTQFVNDAVTRVAVRPDVGEIPSSLKDATRTGVNEDIHAFLSKPVLLATGVWDTQAAKAELSSVAVPGDLLGAPIFANKVRGFYGFRATTVIKVQVNATKFQAGRLILVFVPQAGILGTYPGMRLRNLLSITQLPRIELDPSIDTEVTMEIPYVSPSPYYDLLRKHNPIGKAYLIVYAPLATGAGGSQHVDFTVWGSFKDVELVTPMWQPEMGRPRKAVAAMEADKIEGGTISSMLSQGASVARSFTGFPLLANLAGPTDWFLSAASKAAAAFGYSKPSGAGPITKTFPVGQYFMCNSDGVEIGPKLAVASDNAVAVLPGYGGSDHDEMTISHICQISAWYTTLFWDDTYPADTLLWTSSIEPHRYQLDGYSGTPSPLWHWFDPTPVAYLGKFFSFWRGSFVFTIKIVKTQFHSGRLVFYFNPGNQLANLTIDQTQYCYREILDVREKSEWTFTVPFVSTKQYHQCGSSFTDPNTLVDPIGSVGIKILNDLVHPETCASGVRILIEVAAGPDFEFVSPTSPLIAPFIDEGWAAQMGDVGPTASGTIDCTQCNVSVGNSTSFAPSLEPALYCMGERVLSVLQLMKRYSFMRFNSDLVGEAARSMFELRPYSNCYIRYTETYLNYKSGPYGDPYGLFCAMFAYSRGSVRIGFIPINGENTVANDSPWIVKCRCDPSTSIITNGSPTYAPNETVVLFDGNKREARYVQIPPYSQNYSRLNRPNAGDNLDTIDEFASKVRVNLGQMPPTNNNVLFLRAVGEDFSLGYFLGTPRVVRTQDFA